MGLDPGPYKGEAVGSAPLCLTPPPPRAGVSPLWSPSKGLHCCVRPSCLVAQWLLVQLLYLPWLPLTPRAAFIFHSGRSLLGNPRPWIRRGCQSLFGAVSSTLVSYPPPKEG